MPDDVVRHDGIEPGDLILVTSRADEPLSALVSRLDGSCFSHCGVAMRDGRVASCRTRPSEYDPDDTGGMRPDRIEAFLDAGREVWRMRVDATQAERDQALDFVEYFAHDGGPDPAQPSSFSFVKLFVISAALNARSPENDIDDAARRAMFAVALDAARTASWTYDEADFFCSEFAAAAYDRPFSRAAFDPAPQPPMRPSLAPWPALPVIPVERWADRIRRELRQDREVQAVKRLAASILKYDPGYLVKAAGTLRAYLKEKHSQPRPDVLPVPPASPPAARPIARHVPADDELPVALVTPRMLRDAPWTSQLTCIARPPQKTPAVSW